jgi:hypothetical protein
MLFLPLIHAENREEPTYKGKPLDYWLDDYADLKRELILGVNPKLKAEQTNALLQMGTNAVPWLTKRLSNRQEGSDIATLLAFRLLGTLASSAIPDLVQMVTNQPECSSFGGEEQNSPLPDCDGRAAAFYPILALGGIGKEAVPALVGILTNSISSPRRFDTLEAIGDVGTNAVSALPIVVHYVYDAKRIVASEAVDAVKALGTRQPAGLQALKQIFEDRDLLQQQVRWNTFDALRGFGEECATVVIPALDDTNDYFIAFATLVAAAPHALTNAAVLQSAATGLQSIDVKRQNWAAQLLRAAGQQACGQRPDYATVRGFYSQDYAVPGGDMSAVYWEATNALSRLSPGLYHEYVAAQVPFHASKAD